MKVFEIPNSGFCFGVKRSIDIANKTLTESKLPVYSYGPVIHNPQVVKQLETLGLCPIKSLSKVKIGKLIIRSHGAPDSVIDEALKLGFKIIDATCPFVKKAQNYAKALCDAEYQAFVVGKPDHPEVQSIVGHTQNRAQVIDPTGSGKWKVESGKFDKIGVIAQTTLASSTFAEVVSHLLQTTKELHIYNTICEVVSLRQQHTIELAKKVDLMIVVGGHNSANTTRLAELSRDQGCETYHIETKAELKPQWFKTKSSIGVTAGTSTPDWIIKEIIKFIEVNRENSV
ncbi:4-hydroxy-3-methylbut-2-enyl diphosphate reductase [candidate division WOR-3 bacterium]|nr:4-hydroxy-3-methylbut-2-enyl diphosphate reductase [candidate division WOR-3 bacterium]